MKDAARIAGLADGVRLMNRHAATALLYATEVLDDAPETKFFFGRFSGHSDRSDRRIASERSR